MRSRGPARRTGWGLAAFGLGAVACAGPPEPARGAPEDTGGNVAIVATSDPVSVASTVAAEGYATLAVHDATGRVAVGWHDGVRTLGTLYDLDTLEVVAELRPAFVQHNPNHPQLLAVPEGFWFVSATAGPLVLQRFDASGGVSGVPLELTGVGTRPRDPDLALGPDGQVHVVWTQQDSAWHGTFQLDALASQAPVRVSELGAGRLVGPPTIRAGAHDLVMAWNVFDLEHYEVWARDPSTSDRPAVAVTQGDVAYRAGRTTVAVDDEGGFVVGWREVEAFGLGGGALVRAFDRDGVPRTPGPVALDGSGTGNWVTSASQGDTLVFAWSEGPVGETAVWLQPWSLSRMVPAGPPIAMSPPDGSRRPYVEVVGGTGELRGVVSWESSQPGTGIEGDVWLRGFRIAL